MKITLSKYIYYVFLFMAFFIIDINNSYSQKLSDKISSYVTCVEPNKEVLSQLFRDMPDGQILNELKYLVFNPAEDKKARLREQILIDHAIRYEIPVRIRKNKELRSELIEFLRDMETNEETRRKANILRAELLKSFFLSEDSLTIEQGEQIIRDIASNEESDLDIRIPAIKLTYRPTKKNIKFLLEIIDENLIGLENNQENEALVSEGMMSLARVIREARDREELNEDIDNVARRLRKIKMDRDIRTFAFYSVLSELHTKEGIEIIEKDLVENNYEQLPVILLALEGKLTKEIAVKILDDYASEKIPNTTQNRHRLYNAILRTPIILDTLSTSSKKQDIIAFIEGRKIAGRDDNFMKYDARLIELVESDDAEIRLFAMEAIHYCLDNSYEILSQVAKHENNAKNIHFLRRYGYTR